MHYGNGLAPVTLARKNPVAQAISGARTADAFFNALKNAKVKEKILYPEGGHIINLQRPEETVRDAKAFLDRNVRP